MKSLADFLHMGGYALYVWSAFGLAAVVLAWNVIAPLQRERALRRELAARAGSNR